MENCIQETPRPHVVDCPRCFGDCIDPAFPSQPCAECKGAGRVRDRRPNLSASGNPIALERLLVALWGAIATCEALLEDIPDDDESTYEEDGLRWSAEGLLFNLKSSESFFDSECKWFPALARRRASDFAEDPDLFAFFLYLADPTNPDNRAGYLALIERLEAARSPEPVYAGA